MVTLLRFCAADAAQNDGKMNGWPRPGALRQSRLHGPGIRRKTDFSSNSDKRSALYLERITIVILLAAVLPYTKSEDTALRGGKDKLQ